MRPSLSFGFILAAGMLASSPLAARFAPPTDKALRQTVAEERSNGPTTQRFTVERRLVFSVIPTGYILDLTTETIGDPDGSSGAMFAAGMRALIGRTIRYRLDADGNVTGIEDEAAIWSALCDGIDEMARGAAAVVSTRRDQVHRMGDGLRALPPDRRRAMLASMIGSIIAGPLADRPLGDDRPITLPGRTVAGRPIALVGRETTLPGPDALAIVRTVVAGDEPLPDAGSGPAARLHLTTEQHVDRATGLVVQRRESRETVIGSAPAMRAASSVTTMRLDPMVF